MQTIHPYLPEVQWERFETSDGVALIDRDFASLETPLVEAIRNLDGRTVDSLRSKKLGSGQQGEVYALDEELDKVIKLFGGRRAEAIHHASLAALGSVALHSILQQETDKTCAGYTFESPKPLALLITSRSVNFITERSYGRHPSERTSWRLIDLMTQQRPAIDEHEIFIDGFRKNVFKKRRNVSVIDVSSTIRAKLI